MFIVVVIVPVLCCEDHISSRGRGTGWHESSLSLCSSVFDATGWANEDGQRPYDGGRSCGGVCMFAMK